jgi:hypothetical protein
MYNARRRRGMELNSISTRLAGSLPLLRVAVRQDPKRSVLPWQGLPALVGSFQPHPMTRCGFVTSVRDDEVRSSTETLRLGSARLTSVFCGLVIAAIQRVYHPSTSHKHIFSVHSTALLLSLKPCVQTQKDLFQLTKFEKLLKEQL